jgi:transposase InsO family protein
MRFEVIEKHRGCWPMALMCHVFRVSVAGYYAWRKRPESRRAAETRALLDDIQEVHAASGGRYGSPRIHATLRARGKRTGRGRVERLMRRHGVRGLVARPRRVRTTDSRHAFPIAPNLLERKFTAIRPNQVWLADLTYIPTGEGWLYMAAVMDLHTRKIVGWSMRDHLRAELAVAALTMATQRQRPEPGLIQHSDRGVQYACTSYQAVLAEAGIRPSMSRKGNALDNAPMESFFHTLKTELVHHRTYATHDEAKRDLFAYVEGWYNRQRLHSGLGYQTPDEAERRALSVA